MKTREMKYTERQAMKRLIEALDIAIPHVKGEDLDKILKIAMEIVKGYK